MRIFWAFLIIATAAMLWMLPITQAIYDFRTDVQTDTFTSDTGVGQTTDNVTLTQELYSDNLSSIDNILSSISDDSPVVASYNATTRLTDITGLSDNNTRTLTVSYDVDAVVGSDAINDLADKVPWIWLIIFALFPVTALAAMFIRRDR